MNEQTTPDSQAPATATETPDSAHGALRAAPPWETTPAPEGIWEGSSLDWSSPKVDVLLYVELPFWLLMADGTYDVKYEALG